MILDYPAVRHPDAAFYTEAGANLSISGLSQAGFTPALWPAIRRTRVNRLLGGDT